MKTKIVYVVISGANDDYFEQVWASVWSLKHYNPNAHVVVLTDKVTKDSICSDARKESLNYIDEVVAVEFDGDYSNKEKSRWIKTNMRNLISGDFLFIDADTIICDDLSDVDKWNCSIGAVYDSHCHSGEICDTIVFKDMYIDRLRNIFGIQYNGEDVFNSGVMFVKDDDEAHHFFDTWHKNWLHSNSKGIVLDQLPLLKTNIELGKVVKELPGEYNCQICFSVQYLTQAKIVHTFAHQKEGIPLSPIMGSEIFENIKRNRGVTESVADILMHCKESFASPSYLVGKEWMKIRFQPAYFLIEDTYNSSNIFDRVALNALNFIARSFTFILRHINSR